MRIAINCRSFLLKGYTGIGRYAHNLVKSLAEIDHENEYLLYAPKKLLDLKRRLPKINAKNFYSKYDCFNQGATKILKNIDIYHSPSPDFLPNVNARIIVTVHDLIYKVYPQGHTDETIEKTEEHFQQLITKADKIICCSQNTMNDLKRFFPVQENKACVIYQGVDKHVFRVLNKDEQEAADKILVERGIQFPFILFIGTIEPRKNLSNLIKAFYILKKEEAFDGKLVIAGMQGWMQENIAKVVDDYDLKKDVLFLGYLSDFELCVLYNKAQVFAFPSFYEGFGFPILEAFCCGAAVVTSKTSSCGEVAQDAALQVDPHNAMDIADHMRKIIQDKKFADELKKKALTRAQDFSFEKTAQETLEIYKEVAGKQ